MKRILLLASVIIISGVFNVSCETVQADGNGISGNSGPSRESLYEAQDKAFRTLAF